MAEREQILQALSAVQSKGKALPEPIRRSSERSIDELWAIFEERLKAVGGKMATSEDLQSLLRGNILVEHGIDLNEHGIDLNTLPLRGRVGERSEPERGEEQMSGDHPHPVHSVHSLPHQGGGDPSLDLSVVTDPWTADLSITTAKLAIAESGTLLLETGPDKSRLASLAPPRHIVLVSRESIVESLEEAMPFVSERSSVFITGPSRTADIEGTLVHGVHGPRELFVSREL
ncbi:MAG: LUD domain-containing protein [Fimbriimonadaceae bacterium]|nr:LUD domain-containing protein [Fimbriimonadaceae bacterium]